MSRIIFSRPADIVVDPVYELLPVKVSVPLPALTILPFDPEITPLKVVLASLPPEVNVLLPRVILPAPAIEATVSLTATLYVAPLSTVTAVSSDYRPDPETVNVPALTCVVPVYVFEALKVKVPLPALARFAVPPPPLAITPVMELEPPSVAVKAPFSVIAPAVN